MKKLILVVLLIAGCKENSTDEKVINEKVLNHENEIDSKRKVSFTFDDGITNDIVDYKFADWNNMILSAMRKENVKSMFFVTGSNKIDDRGRQLLNSWTNEGHKIANHTFKHPNFNNENVTIEDFKRELLKTDTVISKYSSYTKLFRFPYLKEGNTEKKRDGFRKILAQNGYKNGHVTIDASDWYINSELIKYIKANGPTNPKIESYKKFYLDHIMERSYFYENLSYQITKRHINHTLLLHHNLTSALFLGDLIERYKDEGWEIIDADHAFEDEVFEQIPNIIPAGESIIWSLAKETGKYEDVLRYPAEDSRYEKLKMEKLGL